MKRTDQINGIDWNWSDVFAVYSPCLTTPIDAVLAVRYMKMGYKKTRELIKNNKEIPPFLDANLFESMSQNRRARIEAYECGALHAMHVNGRLK
ncbi:hypothetical protein BBC27_08060 [Acidithiobacillus ferrivorans]|uniref:Uncharacterized protein n=1 Tax=Acidithiobacillus ferrivorans TaxID=160808 RepID=A0A1B9C0J2_9PROT|nr:hypothetical protein [Acidithiobacillus ferrivorans]OCB03410.1 hypothetical protein BBC27_08060 [Acidithiobacillus ferrivorans]